MEKLFQGYCRAQDQARLVLCDEDGGAVEIDCNYEQCEFRGVCNIGKDISRYLAENDLD